jgi:hypothetical protein
MNELKMKEKRTNEIKKEAEENRNIWGRKREGKKE